MQTIFGTRTAADINLVLQILLLIGLIVGFALARRKRFRQHGNVQTAMVLLNLVLIVFAMVPSFFSYVVEGGTTTGTVATLMMVHGVLGLAVEVVAIYLILRMRTQLIPERLRIRDIKLAMRVTLALWTVLVLLGVAVYGERYVFPRAETSAPLLQMRQLGADLYVHAVELDDAADFSLAAVHRHAEHIINLIEGQSGPDYGDRDANGRLEDPGDGIGLRARLDAVVASAPGEATTTEATNADAQLDRMVALALDLGQVERMEDATGPVAEVLDLARRTNAESVLRLDLAARAVGVLEDPMVVTVAGSVPPDTSVVHESRIRYAPKVLTVSVGTTVEWINDELPKHTVTADDHSFDSPTQAQGDTFSHTFTEPGTWLYYCRFHGDGGGMGMSGTIVVE